MLYEDTRSSSRYAALLLGPCGAGTLASRAGGLRPPWVAFGHIAAPCGRRGAFGSYRWPSATCDPPTSQTVIVSDPVQVSQICDGKSPLSQPALIVFDLVQFSQIRDGKSHLSRFPKFVTENPPSASHFPSRIWEALIVSDLVQISQIRDGKSTLSQPFSVTNLGNPDRV